MSQHRKSWSKAEKLEAIALLKNESRLVVARKLGVSRPKELTEDELESWRTTYRWLGLIYRDKGELARMYSVLREGQSVFPDDLVIDRLLNTAPAPLNLKSQNTWEQNHLKAKGLSTSRP